MEFEVIQITGNQTGWMVRAEVFTGTGETRTGTKKYLILNGLTKKEADEYEVGAKILL